MKLLLVSDLHSQPKALKYLEKLVNTRQPDAIIISGDVCNGDDFQYWQKLEGQLNQYDSESFLIWGNNEGKNIIPAINKSMHCIHLKKVKFKSFNIFGISDLDEPIMIDPMDVKGSILVTHRPPLKSLISRRMTNAPYVHISGHIHSCARKKIFPSTTHICVPSLQEGRYALLEPKELSVNFFKIT